MKSGIELITEERSQQFNKGFSIENDLLVNNHYQLSEAASLLCYLYPEDVGGAQEESMDDFDFSHCCPVNWNEANFNKMMNKPYEERLVIAGALVAAEIDRLQN